MHAISRKLWRDLWHLRGQALAIALVIASGVATYVMFITTLDSLHQTREIFYRDYRFADVFINLKRAPESVRHRISEIPGVAEVDTRVLAPVKVDLPDFPEPVTGLITSVPDHGKPPLNDIYLRAGRALSGDRSDEVIISEAFAEAHKLQPGDSIKVIINGIRKELRIVGTGVTAEYISQVRPGSAFPDHKRHAYMWMARTPLGHAYDMHRAFNSAVLRLDIQSDVKVEETLTNLNNLLERYGGFDSVSRKNQPSHFFLTQEFKTLETLSGVFPVMFLAVAAYLLNVVVSRLIGTQREQIAVLKAFGYRNIDIALHYIEMVMIIVIVGTAVGIITGVWLGGYLAEIYIANFRLPYLEFVLQSSVLLKASLVSVVAVLLGTLFAVWKAVRLRPAEAMRPEAPAIYQQTLVERIGLKRWISPPSRMILRHLSRQPIKSTLSVIGIAMACAILMAGRFSEDTMSFMMDVIYKFSQRQDLGVAFVEPTSRRALYDLLHLPGVRSGEVIRRVPARFSFEHRSFRASISGLEQDSQIVQVLDIDLKPRQIPPEGILIGDYFRTKLGVKPGDWITVEVLEGKRPIRQMKVVGLVSEYLGLVGYMDLRALNRLLGEGETINIAALSVDKREMHNIFKQIKQMPKIAGAVVREHEINSFHKTMDRTMLFYTSVATIFAGIIAIGVVYNSARIILTERGRELASLRVLGFSRGEISYILLGELGILVLLAIPIGLVFGYALCDYIVAAMETDLYRIPLVVETDTYAFAALIVLIATIVSALIVRRRLDRLDLITVLKTKE